MDQIGRYSFANKLFGEGVTFKMCGKVKSITSIPGVAIIEIVSEIDLCVYICCSLPKSYRYNFIWFCCGVWLFCFVLGCLGLLLF